jgi:hypothetical protein
MLRKLVTCACGVLLLIFGYLLRQSLQASPLLGLWDTGRYSQGPLQPPAEMKAPPVDAQLVLTLDASDVRSTPTLGALFDRYGLDNSRLRPTILASGIGSPDDNTHIEVLRNWRLSAGMQLKVPLPEPGR